MGIYLNPGNESFRKAINSQVYVDKTGLIGYTNSVLDTEQSCMCVSRPRRFGKTMAADMLAAYYSRGCSSAELFKGLKAESLPDYDVHMNRYDVIHLDITAFFREKEDGMQMLERINRSVIAELRDAYPDMIPETEDYLPAALSAIYARTGSGFIVIIDEWDALFREESLDFAAQRTYVELLRGLFKSAEARRFIKLAYITGILPVKKYNSESALNNFDEFTMTRPAHLAEYTGFTEDEVRTLCDRYDMDFEEAARWYDGYSFRRMKHVYSPNSVIKAMLNGEFGNYWTRTVNYESLRNYISMNYDGLKDSIVMMLSGGRCSVDVDTFENDMTSFRCRDDVLTILIHLGYLAYDSEKHEVYIPNEEVRGEFYRTVKDTDWTSVTEALNSSDELLRATWRMDEKAVAEHIDEVHMKNTSILNYNDENALSCVISLAYYNAVNEYTIVREMPAGKGYADMIFLPGKHSDKPAMVVELKYDKTAATAIDQIKSKRYPAVLQSQTGDILLVGINYDSKTKKHECVIEKYRIGS